MAKEYRLEDDLLKKSRPRWGSKRWRRLYMAIDGHGSPFCQRCGTILFNPQSILLHQGGHCQKLITNERKIV